MQLTLDIKNNSTVEKLMWLLEHFDNDEIEIVQRDIISQNTPKEKYTEEYIENNWKDIVSKSLKDYDIRYENSSQYKIDRAEFLEMKGKL